jgi:hypothetical protein
MRKTRPCNNYFFKIKRKKLKGLLEASNHKRLKGSQFSKDLMKAFHHEVFQKNIMPKETKSKCLGGHVSIIKSSVYVKNIFKRSHISCHFHMNIFEIP